ncbi:MAG: cytochrome C oxidase subunit I [Ginsengibacter sp.]
MLPPSSSPGLTRNTSYQLVLPFYIYGALSLLVATLLLFFSSGAFLLHYFHPHTLAITHTMALGWGTMMILGASHQLIPVLIEGKIYSEPLGYVSFFLAGLGIPLLVYSFYQFQFGIEAQWGGILINLAVIVYLVNIGISMAKSKNENVHATFVFTGTLWLLITTLIGLFLVYNFTHNILSFDSLHYLPLHAHIGIAGWFLMIIFGVGSRLIPMFLISKYNNVRLLWWIYGLVNFALVSFLILFLYSSLAAFYFLPVAAIAASILLFAHFCHKAYKDRLRKKTDNPLKTSILSILLMAIPIIFLFAIILLLMVAPVNPILILTYGFCIFFGWITIIIFGMTFKTLPFILWNKTYHAKAGLGKTPNPKDLFNDKMFKWMVAVHLSGFILFASGILFSNRIILQIAALLLLIAAVLYNINVFKMIFHKPKVI